MELKHDYQDGEVLSADNLNEIADKVNQLSAGGTGPLLTIDASGAIHLDAPLPVSQGGTGASTAGDACQNLGAVKKSGDTMTGALNGTWASFNQVVRSGLTTDRSVEVNGSDGATPGSECAYVRTKNGATTVNGMYLYDSATAFLKPITLASGGLGRGFASETELKNYLKTLLGI